MGKIKAMKVLINSVLKTRENRVNLIYGRSMAVYQKYCTANGRSK